jgi:hypothetical protein
MACKYLMESTLQAIFVGGQSANRWVRIGSVLVWFWARIGWARDAKVKNREE